MPWLQGATFREIILCEMYADYVIRKCVVVFDGYSTKDLAHQRRVKEHSGVTVSGKTKLK